MAAVSNRGLVRRRNEDALVVGGWVTQPEHGAATYLRLAAPTMLAVLDGMGGHPDGDLASRLAATEAGAVSPWWETPQDIERGVRIAHRALRAAGDGMGTTIVGLLVGEDALHVFNVGDSPAYRLAGGVLELVSVDDAVLDGQGHPTHAIKQALGTRPDPPKAHIRELDPGPGRYLLCSDGVSGVLPVDELARLAAGEDLVAAVAAIAAAVLEAGAPDNLSMLLVQLGR